MGYTMFAAIDIGSSELSMKIYEISSKKGIVSLDSVIKPYALGIETYKNNRISHASIENICAILNDFKRVMKEYNVKEYSACAASAIREADNGILVLDRIKLATGLNVKILSNSEKRYLYYKSLVSDGDCFEKMVNKQAAVVDVGAGSIQISMYENNCVRSTQNIRLGFLRLKEAIADFSKNPQKYYKVIADYINNDIEVYRDFYMENAKIDDIIAVGDNVHELAKVCVVDSKDYVTKSEYEKFYKELLYYTSEKLVIKYGLTKEKASLLLPTAMIYKKMLEITNAKRIWLPKVRLNDGMAVKFAELREDIQLPHDFDQDIIVAARHVANRYKCNKAHTESVENLTLKIFDETKSLHGLGKRQRIWARIAAILHNCGSYISITDAYTNSYNIIMATEIIGLSHKEREIIANIVKYTYYDLPRFSDMPNYIELNDYLDIAKLSAILRLADILDKSHKCKFKNIEIQLKNSVLLIITDTLEDITLEKSLLNKKSDFFIEVYGVKPKLKRKKTNK